jgi:hypothetical protein
LDDWRELALEEDEDFFLLPWKLLLLARELDWRERELFLDGGLLTSGGGLFVLPGEVDFSLLSSANDSSLELLLS